MASWSLVTAIPGATAEISTAVVAAALYRFVHLEGAALQIVTVELLRRRLGFCARAHLHEPKPLGLPRGTIDDHGYGFARPRLSEEPFQVLLRDLVTEIADVKLLSQNAPSSGYAAEAASPQVSS